MMIRRAASIAAVGLAASLVTSARADAPAGDWQLVLDNGRARYVGQLTLAQDGDGWRAHVEGGPAPVEIAGDTLLLRIDTRDLKGFTYERVLTGTIYGERLAGDYVIDGPNYYDEPGGSWEATPMPPAPAREPASPVDLSGTWKPAPGIDLRKYSMDLTPAAERWFEDYLEHYDQPNVRCVSPGIVAMVAWGFYPMEILGSGERLTFLYEVESEVRRVFLDGREPPEFYPTSPMGWSNGNWDGEDLVVETSLLEGNVRDFRGEPVSDGARMHERYSLSEDGNTLSAVITLIDPANYRVQPVRRRQWTRSPDTVFYPYECDPDSFYRQMYNEGRLDMYFDRSERRSFDND